MGISLYGERHKSRLWRYPCVSFWSPRHHRDLPEGTGRLPFCSMPPTEEEFLEALKSVKYPGFSRDIVSFGIVRSIDSASDVVRITLAPPAGDPELVEKIRPAIEAAIAAKAESSRVELIVEEAPGAKKVEQSSAPTPAPSPQRGPRRIEGVRATIAVASGKGGVGKSTVAVNLALALRKYGSVGLLDADVYGPSVPVLLGIEGEQAVVTEERRITPVEAHGMRVVSMGFFIEKDRPVIWRGPMLTKLIAEFISNVDWGELDFLVLDLPPGTGDVQLTLAQQLAMDGGVIVTTPQEVALADVRRGVRMFGQVHVPVTGLIENMSGYSCTSCGTESDVFGSGGGERAAEELGIPFLGRIGLVSAVGASGDRGKPIVEAEPDAAVAQQFRQIASGVARELAQQAGSSPSLH